MYTNLVEKTQAIIRANQRRQHRQRHDTSGPAYELSYNCQLNKIVTTQDIRHASSDYFKY